MSYKLNNDKLNEYNDRQKEMITLAFQSLQKTELTSYFLSYTPPEKVGYMNDDDPIINKIMDQVAADYPYHSGSSISCLMRILKDLITTIQ